MRKPFNMFLKSIKCKLFFQARVNPGAFVLVFEKTQGINISIVPFSWWQFLIHDLGVKEVLKF